MPISCPVYLSAVWTRILQLEITSSVVNSYKYVESVMFKTFVMFEVPSLVFMQLTVQFGKEDI